jgi:peptide/nickel transport system substrate-binding protein
VKAGKLPAVDKRLPEPSQLFVVKPLREIGNTAATGGALSPGPADYENGGRIVSLDKILTYDYTGSKIIPSLARDWKVSDDGKTTTIYLRKGARWSDGTPFTRTISCSGTTTSTSTRTSIPRRSSSSRSTARTG